MAERIQPKPLSEDSDNHTRNRVKFESDITLQVDRYMPSPESLPFTIRAHRLIQDSWKFCTSVVVLNQPEMQPVLETDIATQTDSVLHNTFQVDDDSLPISDRKEDKNFEWYRRDVLGDNFEKRAPENNKKILEYYLSFARLRDEDPVYLINGRDGICATCVIGQHCDDPEGMDEESIDMDDFVRVAAEIGKKEGEDFLVIRDGDLTLRVETTKRTVLDVGRVFILTYGFG